MNRELVTAVANKVSDKDSVILWDIMRKVRPRGYWDSEENLNTLYQLCLIMLEDMESEEE
tara:strand:+ start:197 stop:376 length:180 start_codon:yes stop_codon:yes gene_type:complete